MGRSKEKISDTTDEKDKGEHPSNNGTERRKDETRSEDIISASGGFINDHNNETGRNTAEDSGSPSNETNVPADSESPMNENIEANVVVHIESAYASETPVVVTGQKYDISRETLATKRIIYTVIFLFLVAIIVLIFFATGAFSSPRTINTKDKLRSYAVELSGQSSINDPTSPQAKALEWILNEDEIFLYEKSSWTQRYASAVLLKSFSETTYMNASRRECDWNQLGLIDDSLVKDPLNTLGLHCENNVTISRVNLWFVNMSGTIASEIGYLTDINYLLIGGNPHVVSTIPSEIGKLTNLKVVTIANTSLTGEIPTQIKNARNLENILMYSTNLTGNLEPMCEIPNLRWLTTDCGNGTSKPVYPCVTQCCNPDLLLCCSVENPDSCYSTEYKPGFI